MRGRWLCANCHNKRVAEKQAKWLETALAEERERYKKHADRIEPA
jgi:hypothetical protein